MASVFIKLPKVTGGGGGGGAVDSFNGRTGVVVSQAGDYSATLITNAPAGTIASTNVQGAINELDTDVVALTATTVSLQTQINNRQPLDAELTAIAAISTNGIIARTGAGTAAARALTAGTNITVTNGDGASGNPTVAVSGVIAPANGGTGTNAVPAVGALPIGNGTTYTSAQLTGGAGITVTNAAGSITISNTLTPSFINIDGGKANTIYGGTSPINAGGAT